MRALQTNLLRLDDGAVVQFDPFCLAVLDDDPFDHAAGNNPASVLGDVLAQEMGHMVRTHSGEAEMPSSVDHEGHEIAEAFEVVVETPHGGQIEEEGPHLVVLEPGIDDLLGV